MNGDGNKFNISQEYEIVQHQKGKAYPIGINEWNYIKEKIRKVKVEVSDFYAIGFLLLGAAASCFITIQATTFSNDSSKYFCWALFFISLICGLLSVLFAKYKHKQENEKPKDIINHMDLIESRFIKDDTK